MKCNLSCAYNKRSKMFWWENIEIPIKDLDEIWYQLTFYFKVSSSRKINIFGYEACCHYLKDIKETVENNKDMDKDNLKLFLKFKEHIKNLLRDICYRGYIMTSPSICDEYINIFNKCEKEYNSSSLDMVKLIELFEQLHIEERTLIGKMYGLKIIKNAK